MDLHKEMSVKGVKMEFIPFTNFSGNTNISTAGVDMYTRTRELPNIGMGVAEARACVDYRQKKYGYMKKWVNVEKYNRKNGQWWTSPEK